ncbi:MAG: hypothetical protein ABJA37_15420, partial [Ferruginibacter sp.]
MIFLKLVFPKKAYRRIRIFENLAIIFPFIAFLIFKLLLIASLVTVVLAILLVFINLKSNFSVTVPTPFYKKPFKFVVGFRNAFFLFGSAYYLSAMAVVHDNFNLGIFSLLLFFFICCSFYSKPEEEYFVWCYNIKPKTFLLEKIKTAFLFVTALSVPILLIMSIYFFDKTG